MKYIHDDIDDITSEIIESDKPPNFKYSIWFGTLFFISFLFLFILLFTGCTLSFQNISTHGTATDLVDENQSPTNTVSPKLNTPLK